MLCVCSLLYFVLRFCLLHFLEFGDLQTRGSPGAVFNVLVWVQVRYILQLSPPPRRTSTKELCAIFLCRDRITTLIFMPNIWKHSMPTMHDFKRFVKMVCKSFCRMLEKSESDEIMLAVHGSRQGLNCSTGFGHTYSEADTETSFNTHRDVVKFLAKIREMLNIYWFSGEKDSVIGINGPDLMYINFTLRSHLAGHVGSRPYVPLHSAERGADATDGAVCTVRPY